MEDRLTHLPIGASMLPLPAGKKVDVILSNPAQLPLPQQDRENSPFYAGPDRSLDDRCLDPRSAHEAKFFWLPFDDAQFAGEPGRKSLIMLKSVGLQPRILAERSIPFRTFIDRAWLDKLGGEAEGLYSVRNGTAYETLYVVDAAAEH